MPHPPFSWFPCHVWLSKGVPRLNIVFLTGYLGQDPKPKYFDSGRVVLNLSLAVKREYHPLEVCTHATSCCTRKIISSVSVWIASVCSRIGPKFLSPTATCVIRLYLYSVYRNNGCSKSVPMRVSKNQYPQLSKEIRSSASRFTVLCLVLSCEMHNDRTCSDNPRSTDPTPLEAAGPITRQQYICRSVD